MKTPSHTSRFAQYAGSKGKGKLAEILKRQSLVNGDAALAKALAEKSILVEVMPGQAIITQGKTDTDLYFIVSGMVTIRINERDITTRTASDHVGELTLVDPTVPRSATVIAHESCVLARISENNFSKIAQKYPQLWRGIAIELGKMLRERNKLIK